MDAVTTCSGGVAWGSTCGGRRIAFREIIVLLWFDIATWFLQKDNGGITMPMTEEEVFAKVRDVLTAALAVDAQEIRLEAKLTQDLGAESIDYLDIQFQLEKAFGIKIQPGDMSIESFLINPELVSNGKLTPKGLEELKKRMPFAVSDMVAFEQDPDISKFRDVFTVQTLVRFVMYKLPA